MGDPLVSIVCVTYNHEKFIKDALDGVLAQKTTFPFEIIVGDDASTDNTPGIIAEYAARHPGRIIPVIRERNIGATPNFIDLFSRVRGRYAAICDGDDYWNCENKLQRQVDFLERNEQFALCFHPILQVYDDASAPPQVIDPFSFLGEAARQRGYLTIEDLISINVVAALSVVYRYQFHAGLPRWMASHDIGDYPMHLLHAARGDIGYIDDVMGVYRRHRNGLWWQHESKEHQQRHLDDYMALLMDVDSELSLKYHPAFDAIIQAIREQRLKDMSLMRRVKERLRSFFARA